MTIDLTATIAAAAVSGEILIICLAGFALFMRLGNTLAEAAAYAVVTCLMLLSCVVQVAFICGIPVLSLFVEFILVLLAALIVFRLRHQLARVCRAIRRFLHKHLLASLALAIGWSLLALKALFFTPSGGHWDSLGLMMRFERAGSFFAVIPGDPLHVLFPVNSIALTHLFLRFHAFSAVGLIGFLAYVSIGFSSYALARRYAWTPTAITVTMVVISMPRLVSQAATPGTEIIPAAVSTFCLLAVYRLMEEPHLRDLVLLLFGLLFGISGYSLYLAFPACLVLLSIVLLVRRQGISIWWRLIVRHRWTALAALIPATLFSQIWLFAYNNLAYGQWAASPLPVGLALNTDGLQGALANLLRYVLESAYFTQPVEMLCRKIFNFSMIGFLERIYRLGMLPFAGFPGAAAPFVISWQPHQNSEWFGPLGFCLILPAVIYAWMRGPRQLQAIAVALAGYTFLVCLIPAWVPGNARFFTVAFSCAGFFVAFLLPPWRISGKGRRCLQLFCVMLMCYGAL